MQERLFSITNPTGCIGNVDFVNPTPFEQPSEPVVRFFTNCSLIQVRYEDFILTGPIVLQGEVAEMIIAAYPTSVDIRFLDATGQLIPRPIPGEPFFVRVPATDSTYLVALYAYVDECAEAQLLAAAAGNRCAPVNPNSSVAVSFFTSQQAINAILRYSRAMTPAMPESTFYPLPECYMLLAQLNFFINPDPVRCCPSGACINLRLSDVSAASPFKLPCCWCRSC